VDKTYTIQKSCVTTQNKGPYVIIKENVKGCVLMKQRSRILFVSYFIVMLVLPAFLGTFLSIEWFSVGSSLFLLVFALLLFGKQLRLDFQRFTQQVHLGKFLLSCIGYFLLLGLIRTITYFILDLFMDTHQIGQNQEMLNELSQNIPMIATFLVIAIYAPIVEELVFRQAIMGYVDKNNRPKVIFLTILSVAIFTLLHTLQVVDIFLYLPLSLLLTWLYWKYDRNIIASIIFHFVNNTFVVFTMLILI
jgi:membrane protease YdiL (CAAX protease family)